MPTKGRSGIVQTPTSWPTLVTVKINLEKLSFAPSFHCKPVAKNKSTILCSCSQVIPWNARDPLPALMRPFLAECNTPRFVFHDPKKAEKAKELCNSASKYNGTKNFLSKMCTLVRALSKLCEGKKTPDTRLKPGDTNLRPFRSDRLDKDSVCGELRKKICLPLNPSDVLDHGLGYIYILRSQSFSILAELKIGFSKYHPEHRAHELARCLRNPEVVGHTPLLPHAKRIESIIHTELTSCRKVQFCPQCQRHHREWFTISHIDAREIVTRWSRWMLQRPYRDGVLKKQWRDYLAAQNFNRAEDNVSLEELWSNIIDDYTADDSEASEEQIGSYINAMYWEKSTRLAANTSGLQLRESPEELLQTLKDRRDTYAKGLTLRKPELVAPGPELFDDELASNGRKLRSNTLKGRLSARKTYLKEAEELVDYLKSIKTGCMSVSHEELGISESPLGDSTLLPVVNLSQLEYVDSPAKTWIGYNPTHTGFQFLQEGYQRGDWYGKKPRFKRPGLFRDLEKSRKVRRMRHGTDISTSRHLDEQVAPVSVETVDHQTPPQADRSAESASSRPDTDERNAQCEVKWVPGRKGRGSTLQFSQAITPEFINECNTLVDQIRNGGREEVERKLRKSLAYCGVDSCAPDTDEESSSEESSSEDESDCPSKEGLKQPVKKPSFDSRVLGPDDPLTLRIANTLSEAENTEEEEAMERNTVHEPTIPVEYSVLCGNPGPDGRAYHYSFAEKAPASLCNKIDSTGLSSESSATSRFLRSVVFRHHDQLLKSKSWRCQICRKPAQELLHKAIPLLNPGIGASPDFKPVICDIAIPVCRLAGDCDGTAGKLAVNFLKECFPMLNTKRESCDSCGMIRDVKQCAGCKVIK
jgi:T5orf172 domain